jgi:hypothetical protein
MSTFGTVVGVRSDAGREEFLRYYNSAIEIPSPAVSRIEQISKDLRIFIVVGAIEKDGGTLYCTILFIDPDEGYIAKHRKLLVRAVLIMIPVKTKDISSADGIRTRHLGNGEWFDFTSIE